MKKVMGLIGFSCLLLFVSITFAGIEQDKALNEKRILSMEEMKEIVGRAGCCPGKCQNADCSEPCQPGGSQNEWYCTDTEIGDDCVENQGTHCEYEKWVWCGARYDCTYVPFYPCSWCDPAGGCYRKRGGCKTVEDED